MGIYTTLTHCGTGWGRGPRVMKVKKPKVSEKQQHRCFPETFLSFHAHFPLSALYFHSICANIFPTSLILHLIAFAFKSAPPNTHTSLPPPPLHSSLHCAWDASRRPSCPECHLSLMDEILITQRGCVPPPQPSLFSLLSEQIWQTKLCRSETHLKAGQWR